MMLVPGICTQCGATLSADKTKECMICPYCGTPFIVEKAINNFQNIYNISDSVVNIYSSKENDFVIRAGVLEKYKGADTVVSIPNTVVQIGDDAFRGCVCLEEVHIPEGVINIGFSAFRDCKSLRKVTFPNSLKKIGGQAFEHCESLVELSFPDSLSQIEQNAFIACCNLIRVKMPNNHVSMCCGVFDHCHKLVDVDLPDPSWRYALSGSRYYNEYIGEQKR
ncbi:MAG: leucine-rich repeat domain-containing protein, partial [Oscillospiraceae bacterium]|nr:leucine-rich repeat domain-containing protein [Oscillospiraceae bacterium]